MPIQGETREKTKIDIREPKHYRVIMHNDDFTSMEFVVEILISIFHKDEAEAQRLMLMVHEQGRAAVGSYPYDIAITKVQAAVSKARAEGFPFRLTVEEA
ncbi:MAG: ATP-dependent Clp protease adaptor ClpS [Lachnospiraceae bacterium]|nr:ATP-dependent Clp protease adaptor ClpS [Lachnospiraceae bacterium]